MFTGFANLLYHMSFHWSALILFSNLFPPNWTLLSQPNTQVIFNIDLTKNVTASAL